MSENSKRRNIVMILCDQLRPDFLNVYGADFIPTPNIDALAKEGVVFDNAITASTVCAPARMSFFTGKNVSGHDAWTNGIPAKNGTEYLSERLNAAGYMTASVGLSDFSPNEENLGFQYKMAMLPHEPGCNYSKYFFEKHPEEKTIWVENEDHSFKYPEEDFLDRWATDRATEFIKTYTETGKAPDGTAPQNEGSPFFLLCGFNSPHAPYIAPQEVKGSVDVSKIPDIVNQQRPDSDIPEVELYRRSFLNPPEVVKDPTIVEEERMELRRIYCELIVEVDNLVGRIVKSLKDAGIYENTTIIFTSDHGSVENDYNVVTKGPWPYKSQLFIPMIISNQPGLEKGTHCDALCGNLDIGATALDIADDHKAFGVSRSMIGLADGTVPEREVNLSEFCDNCKTLVDKRYTFTYYPFSNKTCLFDRIADPYEQNNLGGKPEYFELERRFMMHITDLLILAKGIRMEAHDVTPGTRAGIEKKHPKFLDNFEIGMPLASWTQVDWLEGYGLSGDYNEFCKDYEIKTEYGVYFRQPRPEKN